MTKASPVATVSLLLWYGIFQEYKIINEHEGKMERRFQGIE